MKCKEAEKGTERKKERKRTLDILTIDQSDFEVQTWGKKNVTHLHIDFLSVPLLYYNTKGSGCGRGWEGQACPFSLERKEKWGKGRANENRGCFEVGNDIH